MLRRREQVVLKRSLDLNTLGYLAGWKLVSRMPEVLARILFSIGADVAARGKASTQLRRNLARVLGHEPSEELITASMRSYARYWLEAFRLPTLVRHNPLSLVQELDQHVQGKQNLVDSIRRPEGTILVLPHSGNWDMAGLYLVHTFGPFSTVAERLRPETLFQAFVEFRQQLGFDVVAHDPRSTKPEDQPFAHLQRVLESGGTVCLLGERDLKGRGVEVQFFGEATTMPTGAARLAAATGARLHVVHCWFETTPSKSLCSRVLKHWWPGVVAILGNHRWGLSISPALEVDDVARTTQRIATHMAENIARHPADWHMLQPLWLADRKVKNKGLPQS